MHRFLVLTLGLLPSCTPGDLLERASSEAGTQHGLDLLRKLSFGEVWPIRDRLTEEAKGPDADGKLREMAAVFPKQNPVLVRLVGYQRNHVVGRGDMTALTFEWQYASHSVLASVVLQDGPQLQVVDANVRALPGTLEHVNALTLRGKGTLHVGFALGGALALAIIVTALIQWRRARGLRRRWLWLAGILLGVGNIGIDWTTGQVVGTPLAVQLLGIGLTRDGAYGSWLLTVSIPAGALAFLIARPALNQPRVPDVPGA